MARLFDEVPVVLVNKENIADHWSAILAAISQSSYLALDLEMTGLGNRKLLMNKDTDIRYAHTRFVAETRSVLSIGLSCFKKQNLSQPSSKRSEPMDSTPPRTVGSAAMPDDNGSSFTDGSASDNIRERSPVAEFCVETYNILLLCEEEYTVEPISLKFLVSHGFDFNQQYAKGCPYYRGNDKPDVPVDRSRIRDLFSEIVRSKVPVVLHNALVDLVYMYQNFYCQLPNKMDTFLADLTEVFAGGIIDTKYISDYIIRWPASYLEYTFRRCQMENRSRLIGGECHVAVTFPMYDVTRPDVEYRECGLPTDALAGSKKPCENYAAHGNCPLYTACPASHDIDVILAVEFRDGIQYLEPRSKRRRRMRGEKGQGDGDSKENSQTDTVSTNGHGDLPQNSTEPSPSDATQNSDSNSETGNSETSKKRCEGHRAGFDAFMTGFILAHVLSTKDLLKTDVIDFEQLPNTVNSVYMSGKDIPLQVRKGAYAKTSKLHNEKLEKIMRTDGGKL